MDLGSFIPYLERMACFQDWYICIYVQFLLLVIMEIKMNNNWYQSEVLIPFSPKTIYKNTNEISGKQQRIWANKIIIIIINKKRYWRWYFRPSYSRLDVLQGPSNADEGHHFRHTLSTVFRRALGAIQGVPQPPFLRHSGAFGNAIFKCRSRRHWRRHL